MDRMQEQQFDNAVLLESIQWASRGDELTIQADKLMAEALKNIFDGITPDEISDALILGAVALIEQDPSYGYVAARLLREKLFKEITGRSMRMVDVDHEYVRVFIEGIKRGVTANIFDKRMLEFNLEELALSLVPERDHLFDYMGLKTIYERYFVKVDNCRIELPQAFWMRIAMGLSYNESDKNERAIEFYTIMSLMRYVPSTPTLLHAGLVRPQLSSCFLTTVSDDLTHIFKCLGDNAQMSKFSGGVANDWTPLRSSGAQISTIRMDSQGVIPFLKIANDVTAAISRSGSRRGATCVYLETWHLDIEDFLDLRRNTGDERRRTHDINTANWIPDLFMKRVLADEQWTLFSPDETPELHDLYGKAFEEKYIEYEAEADRGELKLYKRISAQQLWRKMITRLFETGHPWITFKDAFNIRSPQDHAGVIHSTNLCTEISLNTSKDETAVCNLGSLNLARHINHGAFDRELLARTIKTAVRMLDNIIDINFYPVIEGENANLRHRPIGLGLMGLQDTLYQLDINFDEQHALEFSSDITEFIAYHAILSSSQLAIERGPYSSYKGSKWDRNIFPQDTIKLLEKERGMPIIMSARSMLDWRIVREHVQKHGMRNSNTMAIAPTATISTIVGTFPSIEPIYKNIYVKANMNGEFTVINKYLVKDLKKLNIWDQTMIDDIKFYDGNVQKITRIPERVRAKYKEVFEIDSVWLITMTAERGKWIDQSQSHNIFVKGQSGKLLSDTYIEAWQRGLKSTYYLRTLSASQIEKSTLDAKKYGFTQKRDFSDMGAYANKIADTVVTEPILTKPARVCTLVADPSCEACQ